MTPLLPISVPTFTSIIKGVWLIDAGSVVSLKDPTAGLMYTFRSVVCAMEAITMLRLKKNSVVFIEVIKGFLLDTCRRSELNIFLI